MPEDSAHRQSAAFWGALPLLLPQAAWVRVTAPRFDGAAGPDTGVTGSGPDRRLLVYGDSIAAGVGASTFRQALVGRLAEHLAGRLGARMHAR